MVYVHLVCQEPFENVPNSASTISWRYNVIESHIGNDLKAPFEPDKTFGMINDYLSNFNEETRLKTLVKGIGVQYYIPISKPINTILSECSPFADEDILDSLGFVTPTGNMFFSSCIRLFPEYKKKRIRPSLTRFMEFSFNIFKVEEVFEMDIYANYLTSNQFWFEFHQHLIKQLTTIPHHNNEIFHQVRNQVLEVIKLKNEMFMLEGKRKTPAKSKG